jgi:hypothetical protein
LAITALAPRLRARLVEEAIAVQPARRQLAAAGVQRRLPVTRDPRAALDERPALTRAAEPKRLEPGQRDEAEPVVELGHVDLRSA